MIDRIVQICVFNDYPVFRYHHNLYRDKIQKLILYPSRHHGVIDMESFLKQVIPETWVNPVPIDYGKEDWRQAETTPCLNYSDADWIWFSEQDFFVKNHEKFYEDIGKAMRTSDMIGLWNATHFPYIHPCCLFIKREMLEKTNKDFSAHPEIPGCDHFAMITRDVERLGGEITTLQSMGYTEWENCFHLGGLTYPYQNWKGDGTDVFGVKSVEVFYVYNYCSRLVKVEQNEDYLALSREIENTLRPRFPKLVLQNNQWREYFI